MEPEIARLEPLLSGYVQLYLKALESGDESDRCEQLRWTYAVLARLLQYGLDGRDEWPSRGWVDDISDFRDFYLEEPPPPDKLSQQGLMTWGSDSAGKQWVEPFSASVRFS